MTDNLLLLILRGVKADLQGLSHQIEEMLVQVSRNAQNKEERTEGKSYTPSKRTGPSPEGKKRIAAAQRKRWAAKKAAERATQENTGNDGSGQKPSVKIARKKQAVASTTVKGGKKTATKKRA